MEDCIFCKIAKGNIPSNKIYENEDFFSVADKNPIVDGHSLIISKKHFENMLDIHLSLGPKLLDCIKETSVKLMKEKTASGFNVVNNNFESAGQVVKHIHFHIIPRKKGDGLNGKLFFK